MDLNQAQTILRVEDDQFIQRLFGTALECVGFNLLPAVDGQASINTLPIVSFC